MYRDLAVGSDERGVRGVIQNVLANTCLGKLVKRSGERPLLSEVELVEEVEDAR